MHTPNRYLYNEDHTTALLLKTVAKAKVNRFETKLNTRFKNPYDKSKTGTSTHMVKTAILYFLNQPQFDGFAIGACIETKKHECSVFFQKNDAIYYNPNFSHIQQGTQTSKPMKELVSSMGNTIHRLRAYHSACGDIAGECSALVWEQLFLHTHIGLSPFINENIRLEPYDHFMTNSAYYAIQNKLKINNIIHGSQLDKFRHVA